MRAGEKARNRYYGIPDEEIALLPVIPEDRKFLLSNFDKDSKYESWGSTHEEDELNKVAATKLVENMRDKQSELLDSLFLSLFGKIPKNSVRARLLSISNQSESSCVRWLNWRNKPIVCLTAPITYTRHSRIFLRWYWQYTEYAKKRIQGRN